MKRLLVLLFAVSALAVPASGAAMHDSHRGNAVWQGSCFSYLGGGHYRNQICGTIYVYVKNTSGVWYLDTTSYQSDYYESVSYNQPSSAGTNLQIYAAGVCGQPWGTVSGHNNPGQTANWNIFNMKVCV